jgi:glutaredoxin-like YruB-family protein
MVVKVYSTPVCPWCKVVKDFLSKNNIEFEDVDVSADRAAGQEMIDKSGQMGVPVTDVDGEIIVGFNEPALRKALKLE